MQWSDQDQMRADGSEGQGEANEEGCQQKQETAAEKNITKQYEVTEADITSATFSKGKHLVAKKKALSKKRPLNSGRSL